MRFTSSISLTESNGVSEQLWRERGIDTVALQATFDAPDWDAAILTVNDLIGLLDVAGTEASITIASSSSRAPSDM